MKQALLVLTALFLLPTYQYAMNQSDTQQIDWFNASFSNVQRPSYFITTPVSPTSKLHHYFAYYLNKPTDSLDIQLFSAAQSSKKQSFLLAFLQGKLKTIVLDEHAWNNSSKQQQINTCDNIIDCVLAYEDSYQETLLMQGSHTFTAQK